MKLILTTIAIVALFAVGAVGTYFIMPVVAPERVAQARQYLDSLDQAAADTARMVIAIADTSAVPDTMAVPVTPVADSSAAASAGAGKAAGSAVAAAPASEAAASVAAAGPTPEQQETEQVATEAKQREQARELSAVLTKMEDAELRALVAQLDPDVMGMLYSEASARNKTRLLQAIPPERAAAFVRSLIIPASVKK